MSKQCPSHLALCGVPCGCRGLNESHYPVAPKDEKAPRWVGEHGPEIVNLSRGGLIIPDWEAK